MFSNRKWFYVVDILHNAIGLSQVSDKPLHVRKLIIIIVYWIWFEPMVGDMRNHMIKSCISVVGSQSQSKEITFCTEKSTLIAKCPVMIIPILSTRAVTMDSGDRGSAGSWV